MMNFVTRLLARPEPAISEAHRSNAAAIAAVHAASFQRGWSEDEVHRLLIDRNVIAHRSTIGRTLTAFILSRLVEDEAEILSVAVAPRWRSRGLSRSLLTVHLRQLAGRSARTVFLEVAANNIAALRLYRRAGFYEVGERPLYYDGATAALVLRRDLG
jgi:[ribosomal protein S18]-alanine N-acetyltransferase